MNRLIALCLVLLSAVSTLSAAIQYSPRQDIATGFQYLYGIAVADFNGDGKQDIAVTDGHAKKVVVYLGKGDGSFSAPITTTLQINDTATSLVAGDFNEDGKQDLVVSTGNLTIEVFLSGNGDGSFTQGTTIANDAFYNAVAVDINHDTHLDLIEGSDGHVSVYLGDGHGNFTLQSLPSLTTYEVFDGVAAGDFNLDQNVDFIAPGQSPSFSSLYYYAGNGHGGFATPALLSSTSIVTPDNLKAGDFNGDGKLDLLVGSASATASVIFGNGDGTFQLVSSQIVKLKIPVTPAQLLASKSPPVVAIADMDGDGKLDAITADGVGNSVDVFLNDGTGKFPQTAPNFTSSLAAGNGDLRVADLNGDGLPDIIVINYLTQNVSVFLSIKPLAAPTLSLTTSANQQLVGTSVMVTAKVSGATPAASGTVTLLDGTTSIGQQTLDATGQAVFTVSNFTAGQHALSFSYAGDKNYLSGSSATYSESITDFQLASAAPSQTVTRGASASYSVSITPTAGFTGNVAFTCAGLPATSTCTASTVAVPGQPATAMINVTTTPATQFRTEARYLTLHDSTEIGFASLLIAMLLRRRRGVLPRLTMILVAALSLGVLAGCGGGSQTASTGSPGSLSGSFPFTITGSTTQGGVTVTHSVSAVLIVN